MSRPTPDEFLPLPFYPFDERSLTYPIDQEEAATALYLSNGDVSAAAELLKVSIPRFNRVVRRSPRLMRLKADLLASAE